MYPHRIRLHGPWDFEPVARTVLGESGVIEERPGDLPSGGRMKMPAAWPATPLDAFRGRVLFRRRFHSPRQLESHEHIWLCFGGVDYYADVTLNGAPVGRHQGYFDPFEFDVTSAMERANELVVSIDCPAERNAGDPVMLRAGLESLSPTFVGGMWRGAALEVRSFARLRDLSIRTGLAESAGIFEIAGQVCGESTGPVELDVTVNGAEAVRQRWQHLDGPCPFSIRGKVESVQWWWPRPLGSPSLYDLKLELHGGAQTLDQVICRVGFRQCRTTADSVLINGRELPMQVVRFDGADDPLCLDVRSFSSRVPSSGGDRALGVYELSGRVVSGEFYDWSDEHGHLLIQGLPWGPGRPSATRPAAEASACAGEVLRQAEAMVRLLAHHPSVVAWRGPGGVASDSSGLVAGVRAALER